MVIKIISLAAALIALVLTFRAKAILQKINAEEPTEGMVLRVKYIALAIAVIAFLAVFITGRF